LRAGKSPAFKILEKTKELAKKDETIGRLRDELEQKDIEIEAIISKVEALLD
jgi:hypothetical protein